MAGWAWTSDWNDQQDEENDLPSYKESSSRDSLILLIDCAEKMFTTSDGSDIPIDLCFKCVKSVLLNKIISSDRDMVGVVFFGTDKDKNPSDFKNVFIYQDLDTPDASRIKDIEELIEGDYKDFRAEYGHCDKFSLSDVLWTCSTMLSTSGSKYGHKRILLFTNCDNPHSLDAAKQDLAENGIEIEVMHMGSSFDFGAFYQDIVFSPGGDAALPNPSERFEELLTRVRSKEVKKRAIQKVSIKLGNGVEIGSGVFCPVREAKKPSFVRLDQRTNEELKTQTKMLCEDTGTDLMPTDIKYFQQFGGERSIFEKEEVQEVKRICEKGFTLMGFKPLSQLKVYHYIKPASFIYPEEEEVKGSTKLFSALLTKCLDRKVFALCRYVPTASSPPRFVALVPQEEELDESNLQVSAPGFHVVYLPYSEDVRRVQIEKLSQPAKAEHIDKAKEIVKKLTFNFQSDSFENPGLQKHYHHLEAIALEKDEANEVSDLTVSDTDLIHNRAGQLFQEFKDVVCPDVPVTTTSNKRKTGGASAVASKRKKTVESTEDCVEMVLNAAKERKLQSLTVNILKEYLSSTGKRGTGRKQELIDRIYSDLGISND